MRSATFSIRGVVHFSHIFVFAVSLILAVAVAGTVLGGENPSQPATQPSAVPQAIPGPTTKTTVNKPHATMEFLHDQDRDTRRELEHLKEIHRLQIEVLGKLTTSVTPKSMTWQ